MRLTDGLIGVLLGSAACRAQECQPFWTGLQSKGVGSMVAFDAGSGPAIYVEGYWGNPTYADPVRRWDGHSFVPVASGLVGPSSGLYVLDDGGGSCLYHRTTTLSGVIYMRRWCGGLWEELPSGMHVNPAPLSGTYIEPRFSTTRPGIAGLYAFMLDYSVSPAMHQVTRWTGQGWEILGGTGAGNGLFAMAEFDTPEGPNLLVSGGFLDFAGIPTRGLARWDGQQWHAMDAPEGASTMITWDDGTGPSLYIGFTGHTELPPLSVEGIARWTGTGWVSVGGGLYQALSGTGGVRDLKVFDDGTGPALFVLGRFDRAGGPGGIPALNIAKWDGQTWHALGAGVGGFPNYLAIADDGRGPSLFVDGNFSFCGGGQSRNICQWVGCAGNRQCYTDCDNNRVLNANDFICFLNRFAAKDPYANCDASTISPAVNPADFACYLNRYVVGCGTR
jgi:trimeric autotransporter adhesin